MRRTRGNPWFAIGLDAWRLGMEASTVIGLRTLKIAQGGANARAETERMINEKIEAGVALQTLAMTGALGSTPASALPIMPGVQGPVRTFFQRRETHFVPSLAPAP